MAESAGDNDVDRRKSKDKRDFNRPEDRDESVDL
jgi:hypothetical protein